jgi:hypothetical protein
VARRIDAGTVWVNIFFFFSIFVRVVEFIWMVFRLIAGWLEI